MMDINRAIEIINTNPEHSVATKNETIEAFKVFFKSFGVDIQDKSGGYKTVYEIFKEASEKHDSNK